MENDAVTATPGAARQGTARHGTALDVTFLGKLHNVQAAAVAALEPLDFGVLAANGGSQVAGLARPLMSGCIPVSVMILPP